MIRTGFPALLILSCGMLEIAVSVSLPFLASALYQRSARTLDLSLGKQILTVIVFMVLVASACTLLSRMVTSHVRGKILRNLRIAGFRVYAGARQSDLQKNDPGDLIQRILGDSETIGGVQSKFPGLIHNGAILAIVYGVLVLYDARISLASIITVACFGAWNYAWKIPLRRLNDDLGKRSGGLYQYAFNFFNGIRQIRAFNMSGHYLAIFRRDLASLKQGLFRRDAINAVLAQGGMLQYQFASALVLVIAVLGMKQGTFTFGDFIVLSGFLGYTATPVMEISEYFVARQMGRTSETRIREVLDLPQEGGGGNLDPGSDGRLEIKGLTFRYPGAGHDSLRNVDMEIPQGASAAIVGESGSGKSTLVNLLLRLYEGAEGRIQIGGTDIRRFDLEKLRRKIGYVTQSVTVFNASFRENIDLEGRFTDAEVLAACESASLTGLLAKLPKGLRTQVGERGAMISGGERQRLGLARTLCYRPNILILDEPTSALDPETEADILGSLAKLRLERPDLTFITISHNLGMVRGCDRIFLLARGGLVASGTHAELAADIPAYRDLFQLARERAVEE